MNLAIFSDFDETITRRNVTDDILAKFAHPSWLEIQQDWLAGRLSAREVLEKQMPLIHVRPVDLNAFVDSVEIDPFFPEFALRCSQQHDSLHVLSDGFDYWIERILGRALAAYNGALKKIPVFACGLKCEGTKVAISFPYFPERCVHGCATCKPALFESLKAGAEKTVVIGDGVSDLLLARSADLVLAKGELEKFCQREGIAHYGFRDFRDVMDIVDSFRGDRNQRASL